MAYCTAQDVIECCSWPGFGQLPAAAQSRFIDAASAAVDRVTRRRFGLGQQSASESFDGAGQAELWLSLRPVVAVASVVVDGEALDNADGDAWSLDGATGRLVRGRGYGDQRFELRWPHGDDNIVVQYWGGYADTPPDVVMATAFIVRYLYDVGQVSGAISQETIGRYTRSVRLQSLDAGLPQHIMGLLQGYVQEDAFA